MQIEREIIYTIHLTEQDMDHLTRVLSEADNNATHDVDRAWIRSFLDSDLVRNQ